MPLFGGPGGLGGFVDGELDEGEGDLGGVGQVEMGVGGEVRS